MRIPSVWNSRSVGPACGTPELWGPQACGNPGLWNSRPMGPDPWEPQACGISGLWDPRAVGTPSLWDPRTMGTLRLWDPWAVRLYGNPKSVGPQDPINLSSWQWSGPRGRCESFISVLLLCIKVCFHPRASLGVRVVCMAGHAWASWLLNPALFFKPQSPRRAKEASVSCQLRGAGDTNKRPGQWLAWGLGASGWHGALVPRWPPHLEPLPRAWGCLG